MNTPTHMLIGMTAFGSQAGRPTVAAALGGMLPDLPAILMVLWSRWVEDRSFGEIFGTLYFSEAWQAILAPWHAVPLWAGALGAGLALRSPVVQAFAASGLLHQAVDFLLHADDPHRHFWPLTDWRFSSPVSYWDPAHYGAIVQPVELVMAVGLLVFLAVRHRSPWMRGAIGVLALTYLGQIVTFALMF